MKRVILADVGLEISRLSFGTASLHHLITSRERQALLKSALDCGISHFDTSPYYGFGLAERELGTLLGLSGHDITVATKVGIYSPNAARYSIPVWLIKAAGKIVPSISRREVDWSVARADSSLNESLKRLRRDYVDILFLHEPRTDTFKCDEFLNWQARIHKAGKVRHFGFAGPMELFAELLVSAGPWANVLQVKDSLENTEADLVIRGGRRVQLTYGYFSSALQNGQIFFPEDILTAALVRNKQGSIIVSTRKLDRLKALAAVTERAGIR